MSLQVPASFFENVSSNTKFLTLAKNLQRYEFNVVPTKELVNILVDYILTNINISSLVSCPFASMWTSEEFDNFTISEDYETKIAILTANVEKILKKQTYDKKVDATLADYIKRIICHVIGGVLGGFKVLNTLPEEDKWSSDIDYIRSKKHENIRNYVFTRLSTLSGGGIISCLEYDHGCAFLEDTYEINPKNNVYVLKHEHNPHSKENGGKMIDNICFMQLDESVHKDNQSKGIYFTSNFQITVRSKDDIILNMQKSGSKYFENYDLYKDRFAVLRIRNVDEHHGVFGEQTDFVLLHMKSVGSKKDILTKNTNEYKFIRELNNAFQSENILSGGDINAPLWGRDGGYLKLSDIDMMNYPFKELHTHDDEGFPFYKLPLLSDYEDDAVIPKLRVPDLNNTQAILQKFGQRKYNTDLLHGVVKDTYVESSALYPDLRGVDFKETVTIPLIDKKHFWSSDHQVIQHTFVKKSEYTEESCSPVVFDIFNTLSDCCSTDQHFSTILKTNADREIAKKYFAEILSKVIDTITFTESGAEKVNDYRMDIEGRLSVQSPLPILSKVSPVLHNSDVEDNTESNKNDIVYNIINELPTFGDVIIDIIRFLTNYYKEVFVVFVALYLAMCLL